MKQILTGKRFWKRVAFRVFIVSLPFLSYGSLAGVYGFNAVVGAQEELPGVNLTSTNMPLLQSTGNPNPKLAFSTPSNIVGGVALASEVNPISEEIKKATSDQISIYIVREGDTLSQIANIFNVTVNTIRWANDIGAKGTIHPGETLVILPISGIKHTVAKGETLASIAKKYGGDIDEIRQYNILEEGASLAVGTEIIIPDGELASTPTTSSGSSGRSYSGPSYSGYYIKPVAGTRSQGLHGHNGVDIAAPTGTPIWAAASGQVIIVRTGGWNGGYGNYVVIRHSNGTQTLYAHNSSNAVSVGQNVSQGDVIGYVGSTGRSTGSHVHFEVRGAVNPF